MGYNVRIGWLGYILVLWCFHFYRNFPFANLNFGRDLTPVKCPPKFIFVNINVEMKNEC